MGCYALCLAKHLFQALKSSGEPSDRNEGPVVEYIDVVTRPPDLADPARSSKFELTSEFELLTTIHRVPLVS